MTTFNLFAFVYAAIIQSEAKNSFQVISNSIKSARKNVNKLNWSHFGLPVGLFVGGVKGSLKIQ